MFDPDDYELHEAQKHACKMAKERDEARVLLDRLAAELAECAAVLPGAYYMDPPDGGDVSVSEQLSRMAKDAERYRLLRRKFAIISDGDGHVHRADDNGPYDVDGLVYCGRCHEWLGTISSGTDDSCTHPNCSCWMKVCGHGAKAKRPNA